MPRLTNILPPTWPLLQEISADRDSCLVKCHPPMRALKPLLFNELLKQKRKKKSLQDEVKNLMYAIFSRIITSSFIQHLLSARTGQTVRRPHTNTKINTIQPLSSKKTLNYHFSMFPCKADNTSSLIPVLFNCT